MNRMVRNILASRKALHGVTYQFGIRVPSNIQEAYKLDKEKGNTLWTDAIEK